jgi:hypothetical protein
MAVTEEERRAVAQTPLFREAQRRLSELQQREAGEFARTTPPSGDFLLKLEDGTGINPR